MKVNAATLEYIRQHARDDVRQLALRPVPADVDLRAALTQIEGRQLAAHKLPTWAATDGLLFPPRLSLEQCSSEAAAAYKRKVVTNGGGAGGGAAGTAESSFLDLTGGLGVDFAAIAPLFARAVYVERQEQLCDLARNNLPLLGLPNAEVLCASAEEALQSLQTQASPNPQLSIPNLQLIYLDPARRDAAGRKVSLIEECTPDICALQDQLRSVAGLILIKLSPMLDLTAALTSLRDIIEVHVVSVCGECKELLLLMRGNSPTPSTDPKTSDAPQVSEASIPPNTCPIHCIDLPSPEAKRLSTLNSPLSPTGRSTLGELSTFPSAQSDAPQLEDSQFSIFNSQFSIPNSQFSIFNFQFSIFSFTRAEEAAAPLLLAESLETYLYEPNASILKAGAFKAVCQRFPVLKLAPHTHLYTASRLIPDFPGRTWRIADYATFSKQDLRRLLSGITAANLTVRGFPTSVASLRQQLHLREGGSTHLIATTLGQQRLLLRVERTNLAITN